MSKKKLPGRSLHPGEHVKIWPSNHDDWILGLLVSYIPESDADYEVLADGVIWILDRSQIFVDDEVPEKLKRSSFAFPAMRRIFPSLIAQQLVSIQPMTMPMGSVFYMDYKYGPGSETKENEEA